MNDGPGSAQRLLGIFAHPDDEIFCAGGTMARAVEAGAEVMIVCATRGERGQIRDATAATRRMRTGDYFGEVGLVAGERTAHVVAHESLTCLVMSRTPIGPYAARGPGATGAAGLPAAAPPPGTCAVDVTSCLPSKLKALTRHRTQYPIVPSILPPRLLERMLGTEFFRCIPAGSTAEGRDTDPQVLTSAKMA